MNDADQRIISEYETCVCIITDQVGIFGIKTVHNNQHRATRICSAGPGVQETVLLLIQLEVHLAVGALDKPVICCLTGRGPSRSSESATRTINIASLPKTCESSTSARLMIHWHIYQNYSPGVEPLSAFYGYDTWRHDVLTNLKKGVRSQCILRWIPCSFQEHYRLALSRVATWLIGAETGSARLACTTAMKKLSSDTPCCHFYNFLSTSEGLMVLSEGHFTICKLYRYWAHALSMLLQD